MGTNEKIRYTGIDLMWKCTGMRQIILLIFSVALLIIASVYGGYIGNIAKEGTGYLVINPGKSILYIEPEDIYVQGFDNNGCTFFLFRLMQEFRV